ncbi:MAG: ROK family transcriptional regulator [Roseibium sp.]|uniref:ROK family transcriptional regulator n=1 Tax=Roseibium sp. TaxID=1936156 RepID=UPI002636FAD1|nr:ROK family transcriptional regulator [Roseibium sp.]MCV0426206.1 ROK family transcriptional regulator [Roseibium sp.]
MKSDSQIKGSNPLRSRNRNRQAVLGQIQAAGTMGRAEIARALGLSTQAVSNIIAELLGEGWILEKGSRTAGRGLPAVQYGVDPSGGYAFGAEIRPDAIFTALLDLSGTVVETARRELTDNSPNNVVEKVLNLREMMLTEAGVATQRLLGTGVVMPGPFGKTGLTGRSSDLQGWENTDAQVLFENRLGGTVALSNDANAAALSERLTGVAQGIGSYAFVYFGKGLGLGLISEGRLISGAFGNAGELGHVPVLGPNGLVPLESILSRVSIQSHIGEEKPLDLGALERLFQQRDDRMLEWLSNAASALGQAVLQLENILDPQTVILGGAMPGSLIDHLIEICPLANSSVSNRPDNPFPRLQRGTCGRMTATLGAASLVLHRAFTPHQDS